MLYTQQLKIPESGTIRIGTLGGEPYALVPDQPGGELKQKQIGYMLKPRVGLLKIDPVDANDDIFLCTASIGGYSNRPINDIKVPGQAFVEFPCSIIINGPAGTNIIVEAWAVDSVGSDRGASKSYLLGAGHRVPTWARSFDLPSSGVATFNNNIPAVVGVINGPVVNFSIPNQAVTVDVAGDPNTPIIFRQQG